MYNCICDICGKTKSFKWHDCGDPLLPVEWTYIDNTGAYHPRSHKHLCGECRKKRRKDGAK